MPERTAPQRRSLRTPRSPSSCMTPRSRPAPQPLSPRVRSRALPTKKSGIEVLGYAAAEASTTVPKGRAVIEEGVETKSSPALQTA